MLYVFTSHKNPLIAITTLHNLEIHQINIKTTFLNGELQEEIYMDQSKGFITLRQEKNVCKVVKSLYGLKQVPKQWHEKFDNIMMSNDSKINKCDKCIYAKSTPNGYVIVCLYMNDMLIFGNNNDIIRATKKMLTKHFDTKDMGTTNVIL